MRLLIVVYIANALLLILHEMESAYWKEWEILGLPGDLTLFLLLHIPVLVLLFWGAVAIATGAASGPVLALVSGAGGTLPLLVHKGLARRKDRFVLPVSHVLIYLGAVIGLATVVLSVVHLVRGRT